MPIIQRVGGRKFTLGLAFLSTGPLMLWLNGTPEGLAAMLWAMAGGVGAIVWGNVQAAKVNGGTKP